MQIPTEILVWLLGTFSAYLLWRVQHQKEKIKDIESQLSERKYKLYSEFVYIIHDLMTANTTGKTMTQKDIIKRVDDIKRDMFLYAPDNIFKTFTVWALEINKSSSLIHFKTYFKLLKLIRKDMGYRSTKIELDDFMLFMMQSEAEYKKFKELHSW